MNLRPFLGASSLALGVILSAGDAFLAMWRAEAADAHDIAARGPFLLSMLMPFLVAGCAVVVVGILWFVRQRHGLDRLAATFAGGAATCTIATLLFLEPTASFWRVVAPVRGLLNDVGNIAVDATIVGVGLWLVLGAKVQGGARRSTTA